MENKKLNLQEIKKHFDSLNEVEQWQWLLSIDFKDKIHIYLDNDNTTLDFHADLYEDEDDNFMLIFKDDIGMRAGAKHLLRSLGISTDNC